MTLSVLAPPRDQAVTEGGNFFFFFFASMPARRGTSAHSRRPVGEPNPPKNKKNTPSGVVRSQISA